MLHASRSSDYRISPPQPRRDRDKEAGNLNSSRSWVRCQAVCVSDFLPFLLVSLNPRSLSQTPNPSLSNHISFFSLSLQYALAVLLLASCFVISIGQNELVCCM
ncbi:Uncharacterized protein HZ326_10465 [Fusarium oxysporum f. sp. albedinis]|nr:Uncharacterized protein HZ326_10465 [Fusarium oxysporum f. sp. albedinis]